MSKYTISLDLYKKTGFTTKTEAIEFANKNNIELIRAPKGETSGGKRIRINKYIKEIKDKRIALKKAKIVKKKVIKQKEVVNDDFIDETNNFMKELVEDKKTNNYETEIRDLNYGIIFDFIVVIDDLPEPKQQSLKDILLKIETPNEYKTIIRINYSQNGIHSDTESYKSTYYTLSVRFIAGLEISSVETYSEATGMSNYSDAIFSDITKFHKIYSVEIKNIEKKKSQMMNGGFFKYNSINGLKDLDLTRYQIFNKINNNDIFDENCLIHSLRLSGVEDSILNNLKECCKSGMIPKRYIKEFAEKNDININIKYHKKDNETRTDSDRFNKKGKLVVNLGLIDEHYFIIEKTNITTFSIRNYEYVKDLPEWYKINEKRNNKYYPSNNNFCDSYKLILALLDNHEIYGSNNVNSLLKKITMSEETLSTSYPKSFDKTIDNLTPVNTNFKQITYEPRVIKKVLTVGFDFETRTDKKDCHEAYLVSFRIYEDKKLLAKKTFSGMYCAKSMLTYIYEVCERKKIYDVLMIAHNITYDLTFLYDYVYNIKLINRTSNNVCGGTFDYKPFSEKNEKKKPIRFNIKDTYAVLPYKLKQFKQIFNLDICKEVIPYAIYNNDYVYMSYPKYSISEACKHIEKQKNKDIFIKNITDWNLVIDINEFNHIEYSKRYCEMDVEVMMSGYFKLTEWLGLDFDLNLDNYLTISSIADAYIKKENCYDGCFELSGIPRVFIQKCAVGGRTMSANNKKYHVKKQLNDFDAVSLYPSAMYRLGGYLKGTPKVIQTNELNLDFLSKQDGYFIEVVINKCNKRDFSLIQYKNKEGIREFTNDVGNGITMNLDKISLEDIMTFQGVKEEDIVIKKGYYFNEGRNTNISNIITKLFNKRKEYKDNGNPIQELYKLMMNSSYGKTLLKEKAERKVFFNNKEKMLKYMERYYNYVIEAGQVGKSNKWFIKLQKPINDHFNSCHIGCEILSMSKRIMNEVMCLSEDLKIEIYYQDTDSMHIEDNKIELLSTEYKKKYNRDLIGKYLGQFHADFAEVKINDQSTKGVSIENITLGKKAYIDKVMYRNGYNYSIDYHYRLKGVPQNVVLKEANDNFGGDLMKLYKHLLEGKEIKFNLLSCGIKFVYNKNLTIKTRESFPRDITFKGKYIKVKDDCIKIK